MNTKRAVRIVQIVIAVWIGIAGGYYLNAHEFFFRLIIENLNLALAGSIGFGIAWFIWASIYTDREVALLESLKGVEPKLPGSENQSATTRGQPMTVASSTRRQVKADSSVEIGLNSTYLVK